MGERDHDPAVGHLRTRGRLTRLTAASDPEHSRTRSSFPNNLFRLNANIKPA